MSSEKAITKKAVLVELNIKRLGATKKDKDVTSKITEQYGTDGSAGNFNKRLFNKEALQTINDLASQARSYHNTNTLSWNDDGQRLLSIKSLAKYKDKMNEFKELFGEATKVFMDDYNAHVEEARKRLADMFNEEDYPPAIDAMGKFEMEVGFIPVPSAADFRIDVSEEELQSLQKEIEDTVSSKQNAALKKAWKEVDGKLKRIIDRLEDPDKVVKSRIIESVKEMLPILETFNFDDDPGFNKIISDISENVCKYTVAEINNSPEKCNEIISNAKAAVSQISEYADLFVS